MCINSVLLNHVISFGFFFSLVSLLADLEDEFAVVDGKLDSSKDELYCFVTYSFYFSVYFELEINDSDREDVWDGCKKILIY